MVQVLIEPLVGRQVRLSGLSSRRDLNGCKGSCIEYLAERQRYPYVIELINGDTSNQRVSVPVSSVHVDDEEEAPSLFSRIDLRDGDLYFGRSVLDEYMLVSIFMERCRVEVEAKDDRQTRYAMAGCAVCGKRSTSMITCKGCRLCQWCDDKCQRHGVEAGHGVLCQQFRALRSIFTESTEIREAARLFHSAGGQDEGITRCIHEARRLSRESNLDHVRAETLDMMCQYAVQWPASAAIATCPPGSKVQLNDREIVEMDLMHEASCARLVPGKLSLCATSHKQRFKALSEEELNAKHTLPCGQNAYVGMSKGVEANMSHAPIQATLKELSTRKLQQNLCTAGCNVHPSRYGGKTIISDVFYSFCFNKVCNANELPGSIQHCPACGVCRNYMFRHCSRCNSCSYGSHSNSMPCMNCHDLLLLHDGIVFVPVVSGQCSSQKPTGFSALLGCTCGNGTFLWNDPEPWTRKGLAPSLTSETLNPDDFNALRISDGEDHGRWLAETLWKEAETEAVTRVSNIDVVFALKDETHAKFRCIEGTEVMLDETAWLVRFLTEEFEKEWQAQSTGSLAFEDWLLAQREEAAAAAKAELESSRESGRPVDKEYYKTAFMKKCDFCGAREMPMKTLNACGRCKAAFYCDRKCQEQAWPKHKSSCKRA